MSTPECREAADASAALAAGTTTSAELVETCLAAIAAREDTIRSWQFLGPEAARDQAEASDARRQQGGALGPLDGIPVGIKDIFDTGDMPTEYGCAAFKGHQPGEDGAATARLRDAGAVILGKTVTTECALYTPGKTRNPVIPAHTPGGSSSGSAAAVGAGMVPAAIGSQTAGSMIRPAAFCGIVGYKPSHGRISRHGALMLSEALDTIGVFARTVEGVAMIADAMSGPDPRDPDTGTDPAAPLLPDVRNTPAPPPRLAFVRTPMWDEATPAMQAAMTGFAETLADQCGPVDLPPVFDDCITHHRTVMFADVARNIGPVDDAHPGKLSPKLREIINEGRKTSEGAYEDARAMAAEYTIALEEIFSDFDAILTPPAPGPAPEGLGATGDPVFCALWTFCGVPAVSLPLQMDKSGLPLGIQLVGRKGGDGALLRTARWLERTHLTGS